MDDTERSPLPKVRIEALALRQHGLLLASQARERQVPTHQLARSGHWTRVRGSLYRLTAYPTSWRQDLMAAVLVGGPGALASHRAAARLHGLDGVYSELVEVTVATAGNHRNLPGVVVHRSAPVDRTDRDRTDGFPVTTVTRTLIDLGAVVDPEVVESALESALRANRTSLQLLHRRLEAVGGRGKPGTASLRRVLAARLCLPPTGSELETRFVQLCRRARIPDPARQASVAIGAGRTARVDFAWPDRRVLVELDGFPWHGTPAGYRSDMRRQNAIVLARPGWTVLRFGWRDVVGSPGRVVGELAAALRLARNATRGGQRAEAI
ncbi:MAG: DUF559 domain-containing protein [Acidimicrobiales bacterium]